MSKKFDSKFKDIHVGTTAAGRDYFKKEEENLRPAVHAQKGKSSFITRLLKKLKET